MRRPLWWCVPVLVVVSSLAYAKPKAPAAPHKPRRYALRGVRATGVSEAEQRRLEDRIFAAVELLVSDKGDELIHVEDVAAAIDKDPRLKGCDEPRCDLMLGDAVGAERVLAIEMTHSGAGDKGDWNVTIKQFAVDAAKSLGAAQVPCRSCTSEDVLGDLAHSLEPVFQYDAPLTTCALTVVSSPPGARVSLDGEVIGETPFQHTVASGKRAVMLEKEGFERGRAEAACIAGTPDKIDLTLAPMAVATAAPAAAPVEKKRSPVLKAVGGALIGVGVLGVVLGAVELAYDGKGSCSLTGGHTQCPQVYDTKTIGGVFVGIGAVAIVGGAVAIVVDTMRAKRERAGEPRHFALDLQLSPSSAGLTARGQF